MKNRQHKIIYLTQELSVYIPATEEKQRNMYGFGCSN
jgi:hypothetical protein